MVKVNVSASRSSLVHSVLKWMFELLVLCCACWCVHTDKEFSCIVSTPTLTNPHWQNGFYYQNTLIHMTVYLSPTVLSQCSDVAFPSLSDPCLTGTTATLRCDAMLWLWTSKLLTSNLDIYYDSFLLNENLRNWYLLTLISFSLLCRSLGTIINYKSSLSKGMN